MKVVIVANSHDAQAEVLRDQLREVIKDPIKRLEAYTRLSRDGVISGGLEVLDVEVHEVDFNALRGILPISVAPTVFIEVDGFQGSTVPVDRLPALISHIRAYQAGKGKNP